MAFALLCLFFSAVWHTMSGCADPTSMEFCARIDYVGIGWCVPSPLSPNTKRSCHLTRRLISASIGTIVHYGFQQCYPRVGHAFLCLCFLTGLAGNIFPFMAWFNQHKYRVSVSLCISPTHGLKTTPIDRCIASPSLSRWRSLASAPWSLSLCFIHEKRCLTLLVRLTIISSRYGRRLIHLFLQPQFSHLSYHT